jgi:hypothetical protein
MEQSHHLGIFPQVEGLERLRRRPRPFISVAVVFSHLV